MSLSSTCPTMLDNAVLSVGFCAFDLAIDVGTPRSVVAVGPSDALVLDRSSSSVLHVFDSDNDGRPDSKQTLATASGLNHGLALHGGYIYASSDTAVYRWPYTDATFSSIGDVGVVVENINADGTGGAPQSHTTRTLAFDDVGRLYISVGSYANVDQDSYRSRIRRFSLDDGLQQDFSTGEVFADGLRNEVGLAFDKHGVLWGVENGPDNLVRSDLGGDIHNDNPAEELNRFREEDAGKHWGYPFCWTEYSLQEPPGLGRGTVWAWPDSLENGRATDASCRADYVHPVVSMQAHSAPLGITFYSWIPPEELPSECQNSNVTAFPREMDGYAFIAFHGSWNRDIPTGYKVVYIAMDENGDALGDPVDFLAHVPPNASWEDGFRPVDVDFDFCGRLLLTSDGTSGSGEKLVRIEYTLSSDSPFLPNSSSSPTGAPSPDGEPESGRPPSPATGSTAGDSSSVPSGAHLPTKIGLTKALIIALLCLA